MENFDDFFDNQYKQNDNPPNYHTPDKKPANKKHDKQQVVIICLSVLIVVMVIAMIVNTVVLTTMQDKISGDYVSSMKQDMEDSYNSALNEYIDKNKLVEDLKDEAIQQLQITVGELAKIKCWDSVVQITSRSASNSKATIIGSGFIIQKDINMPIDKKDPDNIYVVTNAHVIVEQVSTSDSYFNPTVKYALNDKISCTFAPKEGETEVVEYPLTALYHGAYNEILAAEDNRPDLAILKFTKVKPDLSIHKPVEFAKTHVTEGDPVAVIGSPQGIGISISTGAVSKTNLEFGVQSISTGKFFMTDAAINGGNSGGPVFNKSGELIGVVESKIVKNSVESMGFAISLNTLNDFLTNLNLQYSVQY